MLFYRRNYKVNIEYYYGSTGPYSDSRHTSDSEFDRQIPPSGSATVYPIMYEKENFKYNGKIEIVREVKEDKEFIMLHFFDVKGESHAPRYIVINKILAKRRGINLKDIINIAIQKFLSQVENRLNILLLNSGCLIIE